MRGIPKNGADTNAGEVQYPNGIKNRINASRIASPMLLKSMVNMVRSLLRAAGAPPYSSSMNSSAGAASSSMKSPPSPPAGADLTLGSTAVWFRRPAATR